MTGAGGVVQRGVAGVVPGREGGGGEDRGRDLVELTELGGEMERGVAGGVAGRETLHGEGAG